LRIGYRYLATEKTLRIFKKTWYQRFSRRENITDEILKDAIARAEKGTIDADLGGNIIKQRIARVGQGKSGGYRTIIVFKKDDKAFFVYGFAKSERENIDKSEIEVFKKAAKELLALSDKHLQELIDNGALTEVEP
jgi:hypothetical protein